MIFNFEDVRTDERTYLTIIMTKDTVPRRRSGSKIQGELYSILEIQTDRDIFHGEQRSGRVDCQEASVPDRGRDLGSWPCFLFTDEMFPYPKLTGLCI